jgi:hypothetical protein
VALEPAGKVQLKKHDMHLAGRESRRADQFVDIYGARSERAYDLLALALADLGQRLRGAVLVGCGKLDRRGRGTPQDRRQGFEDVARGSDEAGALLQEIVGAGRARIERAAGNGEDLAPLLAS